MRYMHNVKQGSDVFKMPGIPRTLHLWQEMYRERSITRGRNPFINLNKCDPWKGSAVNGFPDWLLPLRIHVKVKHSLAGCFGCFNSSNTAWKHETNHQDWLCFSGWRNGCDFQGKSIQDFLMHALPGSYLNWNTEWINDLWWTSDRKESHSSLRRNVFS